MAEAAKVQSPVAAWISQARTPGPRLQQHAAASLQQQSGDLLHRVFKLQTMAGHSFKCEVREAPVHNLSTRAKQYMQTNIAYIQVRGGQGFVWGLGRQGGETVHNHCSLGSV